MAKPSTKTVSKSLTAQPPFKDNWPGPSQIWKLDRIKPYARNARTHPPAQIALLAKLLKKYGPDQDIVVDEDGVILKGHGRRLAALEAEFEEFPVTQRLGLSEADKRAMRIADNQVALLSGWNDELLRLEAGELKLDGFDMPLLGFSNVELTRLTESNDGDGDPDQTPEPPKKPVSRTGDLWILGNHRVLCGDSTDAKAVARLFGETPPVLLVTDPPYGVNYDPAWRATAGVNKNKNKLGKVSNDDRADWTDAWKLFPGDVAYVWHGALHATEVEASLKRAGLGLVAQVIWGKDRFALSRGDYHWQHEPCLYVVREGRGHRWVGGRNKSTLWTIPAREDGGHGHGTQKPVECMKRPIENNSVPGEVVYDSFLGSGTTLIACEMTARRCVGMELDPSYVDVVVARWEKFTGLTATLETGETFAELKKGRPNALRNSRKPVSGARRPAAPARRAVAKPPVRPAVPAG